MNKQPRTKMETKHYIAILISLIIALVGYCPYLNIEFIDYVIIQIINLIVLVIYLVYLDNKQIKAYNESLLNQGKNDGKN